MHGNAKLFPKILGNIKLYKHYTEKWKYINLKKEGFFSLKFKRMFKLSNDQWESKQNKQVPSFMPYSLAFQIGGKDAQTLKEYVEHSCKE